MKRKVKINKVDHVEFEEKQENVKPLNFIYALSILRGYILILLC